jgi:hypothetical protein
MKTVSIVFFTAILLIIAGCQIKVDKKINILRLKPVQFDSIIFTSISIVKTYPAKKINSEYSNLYKCTYGDKDDTIYVFEINKKIDWVLLDEIAKENNGAIIDKEIAKNPPHSTLIYVPKDFNIPDSCKYIFASPGAIME